MACSFMAFDYVSANSGQLWWSIMACSFMAFDYVSTNYEQLLWRMLACSFGGATWLARWFQLQDVGFAMNGRVSLEQLRYGSHHGPVFLT